MERNQIFNMINKERDYQDSKWEELDKINSVGDYIIYMERYLQRAKNTYEADYPNESLENIIKLISIGVCVLEKHGSEKTLCFSRSI